MKSRLIFTFLSLSVGLGSFAVVAKADDKLSAKQVAWFETNIRPILAAKCYSCHSAKKNKDEGGLTLDFRSGWKKGGDRGPAIVPGDPDASLLIRAVRYSDSDIEMPPDQKLTERQIKLLEEWVKTGALDPRTGKPSSVVAENPADPVAGKSHWAYRPLAKNVPPKLEKGSASPIDSFVRRKLNEKRLKPNALAAPRVIAQRLSMLLVGLPLEKSELDQFAADSSPQAYALLVERLLGSPRFGEVWGRHWLDLARYADSNGLDENFLFREAWRYRNWVINAINEDQSFDEFTREQIAGDLLKFDSLEERDRQRIGAGFLVVGPKVLLGVNGELQKMDVADELISTVGSTFLGQTLGCARCHDHKFDPIPTKDYYAMAGIFTSTEVMQTRYMLGQQRKMERLFGLGQNENKLNAAYEKYWRERGQLKKRLDHAKQVLERLKKKETQLSELVAKDAAAMPGPLKQKLQSLIQAGVKQFSDLEQKRNGKSAQKAEGQIESKTEAADRDALLKLQNEFVQKLSKQYSQPPAIPARAMIPTDKSKPGDEPIRIAGQFNRKGKSVPRGFLQVLSDDSFPAPKSGSGRLELADWLTNVESGAGRLTARVLVNRIWHHLFGRGIVRTTDNFGRTGEKPSHPELLDYLAVELVESGWSIKHIIRLIVLSETFRQSSVHRDLANQMDPENRLLWRAHRRRLTPEAYRDRMLIAADQLDLRPLGSTVNYLGDQATAVGANTNRRRTDFPNRSVYLPVIRNDLPEIFEAFDFANAHRPTGNRPETTVATTGLYILNDPLMQKTSRILARQLLDRPGLTDRERVKEMYASILGQDANEYEIQEVLDYVTMTKPILLRSLKAKLNKPNAAKKSGSTPRKLPVRIQKTKASH